MASKMKRTKKLRAKKTSPNTAGPARREAQAIQQAINEQLNHRTPWQKAKDKRFHSPDRVAKRNSFLKKKVKA